MATAKKSVPKKAAKKAAAPASKKKLQPDQPNGPSSKAPQSYGGNQSTPLDKRPNGGKLS